MNGREKKRNRGKGKGGRAEKEIMTEGTHQLE
jgi:hypothetical protein